MIRPDYLNFIEHSVKGSTWKKHKYVKKENGRYYYPDSSKAKKESIFENTRIGIAAENFANSVKDSWEDSTIRQKIRKLSGEEDKYWMNYSKDVYDDVSKEYAKRISETQKSQKKIKHDPYTGKPINTDGSYTEYLTNEKQEKLSQDKVREWKSRYELSVKKYYDTPMGRIEDLSNSTKSFIKKIFGGK